jgi:hypothetical protein
LKVSEHFSQFEANFVANSLFFQVGHFLGTPTAQIEQHMLVFSKTLLNSDICYSFIPGRKWLWKQVSLHLVVEICASSSSHLTVSPETVLPHHIKIELFHGHHKNGMERRFFCCFTEPHF